MPDQHRSSSRNSEKTAYPTDAPMGIRRSGRSRRSLRDVIPLPPAMAGVSGGRSPLAAGHDALRLAVGSEAVDVDPVRSDHPVDVNEAAVRASRRQLVRAHRRPVADAAAIGLAE